MVVGVGLAAVVALGATMVVLVPVATIAPVESLVAVIVNIKGIDAVL